MCVYCFFFNCAATTEISAIVVVGSVRCLYEKDVLDSTQGGGVLVADGKDLLADVKKQLGF